MFDGEYGPDNYTTSKISIGAIINNPEMLLILVLDHFKTKKTCNYAVKKLLFVVRYVCDLYKTQEMCDKAIPGNSGTLKDIPGCYKNEKCVNKLSIITLMH